jgi:rhodanese-related sulfurtransferase
MKQKTSVSLEELKKLLAETTAIRIVDVRTEAEYRELHIPEAIHVPEEKLQELRVANDEIIITVCGKGGGRSEKAAELLRNKTKNKVYFLENGTFGWYSIDKK